MIILAIDPSIRSAGAALFRVDQRYDPAHVGVNLATLIAVTRITVTDAERGESGYRDIAEVERLAAQKIARWATAMHVPDMIVSERPQIYQRGAARSAGGKAKSKADPNDQLPMVGVTAGVAALLPYARVKTYLPYKWKGQLDKPKILRRVRAALRPDELALLDAAGAATDPGEAVGVGLKWLGRLEPHRVYPGATPG